MTTETNTLKDGTIITGFKNDLITNGLKASQNYYELAMLEFIKENIPSGVMVDCGANIGNHTIYLAKYCATEVIAFEPFTDTFNILDGNIMKNGLNNVRCMDVGLSNEYKNLLMKSIDGNAGMNRIDDKGIMPILVVPFDEIGVGGSITLIKLDCEGYEEKALLGMIKTINEHQPALFIECQTEKELVAISKILIPLGYSNKRKFNATPTYYFDVR